MRKILTLITVLLMAMNANAITLKAIVPTEGATGVNIEGKIVLTFDVDVMVGAGTITLDDKVVTPVFVSKYTTISFAGLDYETVHTLIIPAGAIKSKTGDLYGGITLKFTTKKRPDIAPKLFDFVVDPKASPVFGKIGNTIASAIAAAPNNSGIRYHVLIKNGNYTETLSIPSTKTNISFIGQSTDSVVIKDISCPVVTIEGSSLYFENLTIKNTVDPNFSLYSIAAYTEGFKNIYKNVRLLGNQDTQRNGGDRHYFLHCDIRGTIDFIYGSGNVFYDSCAIFLQPRNRMMNTATTWDTAACITAGNHDNATKWGFVFSNCSIDGDASNANRYSLGRPWHNSGRSIYLNTTMHIKPFDYGWTSMGGELPGLYAEYNSMDAQGVALDLSKREARYILVKDTITASFSPVLDSATASTYTLANVLSGTDAWKPNKLAVAPAAPAITHSAGKLTWTVIPYTMCYVIYRDGRIVDYSLTGEYAVSENGSYTVKAAGEYGNLSETSNVIQLGTTGVESTRKEKIEVLHAHGLISLKGIKQPATLSIYNLSGIRMFTQQVSSDIEIPFSSTQPCIIKIVSEQSTVYQLLPVYK